LPRTIAQNKKFWLPHWLETLPGPASGSSISSSSLLVFFLLLLLSAQAQSGSSSFLSFPFYSLLLLFPVGFFFGCSITCFF